MGLFDSHAHYDDERFSEDREALLSALPEPDEACPCGVEAVVNVGCSAASSRESLALAEKYPFVYAAVGIHPQHAEEYRNEDLLEIERLLQHPKAVALGEIGLDYHYLPPSKEAQRQLLRKQLQMAERLKVPVIIHDREAHGDLFEILRETPGVTGVFHSYSGSAEMARQLCRKGWMISFSGTVTFQNAPNVAEAAKAVPPTHLLVETDAPYLAPVPYRGKRNDSRKAYATAAKLAEIHGVSPEEMLKITCENAKRFFHMAQI